MGIFGLSFGSNKKSSNSITDINKTETGTQSGSESTGSLSQTNSASQSSTTNQSSGTSSTSTNQTQTGTTSSNLTNTGSSSSFSSGLASGIEGSILDLLGSIGEAGSVIGSGVERLGNFDADAFVNGIVQAANTRIQGGLDTSINGLFDQIGGTSGDNSMAALLSQRLTSDAAANLAGVGSQANAQAQQILANNLNTQSSALASVTGLGPALIQALKGGNVTTNQIQTGSETSAVTNEGTSTTNTSEQSQQFQQAQQTQTNQLIQIINQLLNTNMNTVGQERTNATQKSGGFGFSLG